jgi:hypothetical protein
MRNVEPIEYRIPFMVESQRGDDRLGTNPAGDIISDFEAKNQGVPFEQGIPKQDIQKAVETQLKNEKWVCIEKHDGSTELLTKKDIPKCLYPAPQVIQKSTENVHFVQLPHIDFKPVEHPKSEPKTEVKPVVAVADIPKVEQPKPNEDWKTAFNMNPPVKEPAKSVKQAVVKPVTVNQTCTEPKAEKKDKTVWESKFEDIKSATATHKGKGG